MVFSITQPLEQFEIYYLDNIIIFFLFQIFFSILIIFYLYNKNQILFQENEEILNIIFDKIEILGLTNSDFYWFFTILTIFFFFFEFGLYKILLFPYTIVQYIIEFFYNFIYNLIYQQIGKKGEEFFPLFFSIFILVLFSNIIGLTPYGFTNTSSLVQTLWLSFTCLIGLTIIGFQRQGKKFLNLFFPSGVPSVLMPLLVMIEVVSYLIRPISLGVRLFANMMSGHSLLYILSGFVISLSHKSIFFAIFPFFIVLAISFLELGISFLQAYVFVVLLCMYLNDSFNANH